MGHIESVGNMLKKIDVFGMNSRFEGLGLVMLEAMFFSKPIIAPKISAIPEVAGEKYAKWYLSKSIKS